MYPVIAKDEAVPSGMARIYIAVAMALSLSPNHLLAIMVYTLIKKGLQQLQMIWPTNTGQKFSVFMQRDLNRAPSRSSDIANRRTPAVLYFEYIQTHSSVIGIQFRDYTMTATLT